MKNFLLFTATLATALVGACGDSHKTPATTTGATTTSPVQGDSVNPSAPMAGHNMAGMASPGSGSAAASGSLTGAMAKMMQQMNAFKPIGNTDHDFAHMMMAHHEGAVAMSKVLLRDGQDATMRRLAGKIMADQTKEIGELDRAAERLDGAARNYTSEDPKDKFQARMDQSMKPMMVLQTPSGSVDKDFATMMRAHHTGAVQMAEAEVALGQDAPLKKMAQQMISAQQKEIQQFNEWLAKNGGKM